MRIQRFTQYLNEDLVSDVVGKISETNKDLKEDLIKMIQKSINSDDMDVFIEKLDFIVKNPNESTIEGLINDSDVYDFYIKYRNEIDEKLTNDKFFENLGDFQKQTNCVSLYDFVVKSTKKAITSLVGEIKEEVSGETGEEKPE